MQPYLFENNIRSSQDCCLIKIQQYRYFTLKISSVLFLHSISFCFSCVIITSSLCVSWCHEKIYYNLQVLKEQSLKPQLYFSHLKVTDTKDKDEQRAMNVCNGWESLEVICFFVQRHKSQICVNSIPIVRSVLVLLSFILDLNKCTYAHYHKIQSSSNRNSVSICSIFKTRIFEIVFFYFSVVCHLLVLTVYSFK